MIKKISLIFSALILLGLVPNCKKTDFSDGGSVKAQKKEPSPEPPPPPKEPECNLDDPPPFSFTGDAKACVDSGHLWNFDAKVCSEMPKASFDCSFEELFKHMEGLGLKPSTKLTDAAADKPSKAIIVGCGETTNKKTVAIQWFFVTDKKECNFNERTVDIVTGCYGENSGAATSSNEEKLEILKKCLKDK